MTAALSAEWLKLRTIRSTWYVLGAVGGCVAAFSLLTWYATVAWDRLAPGQRAGAGGLAFMPGLTEWCASLCLAVLGVLTVTSEYGTGMIRTTFTVMPHRSVVLAAKALVVAPVAFVTGEVAVFVTFATSRLIIGGRRIPGNGYPLTEAWPTLLAAGVSVTMFALIGFGLAAALRSAVAAVAVLLTLWYGLPIVSMNLPAPWNDHVGSLLPGALGTQLAGGRILQHPDQHLLLPPLVALVVMAGYAVVPVAVAVALTTRRDAG